MIHRLRIALVTAGVLLSACSRSPGIAPGTLTPAMPADRIVQNTATQQVHWFGSGLPWPEVITKGPDGNLWFTEFYAEQVARITPSGVITQFNLPGLNGSSEGITTGPDGNLWIAEASANAIGRLTTKGVLTDFQINGLNPSPRNITAGPDGNLWFAEFYDGYLGRITTSGKISRFLLSSSSTPWDVIAAPDGNVWVTDDVTDAIWRFDPVKLKFLPSIKVSRNFDPWAFTIGPDHNVWLTGRASGKIATVVNGKVSEFTIPGKSGSYPDSITSGPDGNLWFVESLTGGIGRFNPSTKTTGSHSRIGRITP